MADEETPNDLAGSAQPDKKIEPTAASPAAAEAIKVAPQAVKRSMPMGLSITLGILLAGLIGWVAEGLVWFFLVLYLSFVAATILEAPVQWLKRHGIRRGFAAVIVMLSLAGGVIGGLYLITNSIYSQVSAVSTNLEKAPDRINTFFNRFIHRLPGHTKPAASQPASGAVPPAARSPGVTSQAPASAPASAPATAPATAPAFEDFDIAKAIRNSLPPLSTIWSNTMGVVEAVSWLVITFFVVLYMLVDGADHLLALRRVLPRGSRLEATQLFHEIAQAHRGWALASLSNVCSASILIGSGLFFIGIPGGFLLGFIAGLGELIPNIGPVLGATPALLFTLLMEPDKFLYVVGMILVAQTIQSYTISPMMLKFSIELPVLVTIISVLVFGLLFGFLGILVAIPIVADMVVIWGYVNRHMEKDTTDYDVVNAAVVGRRESPKAEGRTPRFRIFGRGRSRPDAKEPPPPAPAAGGDAGLARLEQAERRATEEPPARE